MRQSTNHLALQYLRAEATQLADEIHAVRHAVKVCMRAADKEDPRSRFAFVTLNAHRSVLRRLQSREAKVTMAIKDIKNDLKKKSVVFMSNDAY